MMRLLQELAALFEGAAFQWPICGGLAVDLFIDKETRTHGDIDLAISEPDRQAVIAHVLEKGWKVYEYRGGGLVCPITGPGQSETGRNLMCLRDDCTLVKFYPYQEGLLYHEFIHTGMDKLDFLDLLFHPCDGDSVVIAREPLVKRERSKAVLDRDGIPFLAPEIVLLYKAANLEESKNQADFENAWPLMNDEQRRWFHKNLCLLYPDHPWTDPAFNT